MESFHPAVARWFSRALGEPTTPQRLAWPAIARGSHALIAAPTGSGKTLAAFLAAIDSLVREGVDAGELPDESRIVYVSPLKALSHDIHKNLQLPLDGVAAELAAMGIAAPTLRTWVRTGDTDARSRAAASKKPPHIVVTTPESLYLLLTSEGGRRMLRTVRTVIVDEIHALVRDKRGSHLALSLERLDALVREHGHALQRVGLSATQRPIEEVARFLVGAREDTCHVVDAGHRRDLDIALELPRSLLEPVTSAEVWDEVIARLTTLIAAHTTTIVFVNTRKVAERVARQLSQRLGEGHVTSHHGSLSRDKRLEAEQRLKRGELKAMVTTASLELGIDIGDVDLVCQLGSPRSIATFVQRVGRSGHHLRGTPKGRLFPLTRDDFVECAALLRAVREGELDRLRIPEAPLDVLAQQLVAEASARDQDVEALYAWVRHAAPYRELARENFDAVLRMLAEGFSTRRGRRAALLHLDAVQGRVRGRRGTRLLAMTSGGAIPDSFDYDVVLEPENTPIGSVHEDFAIESSAGDVFQLGNASYQIRKLDPGVVRVTDARGKPPTLPFWIAEAPGRTDELSREVSRLRADVDAWLDEGIEAAITHAETGLSLEAHGARQLIEYLAATRAVLGAMPTTNTLVLERFFDETGSMHLVLHAPFGTRLNRAFGLALRKRFCRSFNVELQAAASDDAIVLSLGPMHSFALDDVFRFLRSHSVRDVLVQALLVAPMFNLRFRWNASRSLGIARFRGGKKVAPRIQRMMADDLLAVCFPEQVACAENLEGEREVPDHPLVRQTVDDCLHEAMDVRGLEALLARIEAGEVRCVARDVTEPSPLAHEILNARPFAFLDDAPLEERRTQAVMQRRWLDPATAGDLGALDPAAIARVCDECRPDPRDADELHDALLVHAALGERVCLERGFGPWFDSLREARRVTRLRTAANVVLWVPAERVSLWRLAAPFATFDPELEPPRSAQLPVDSREDALREVVRGTLEAVGPTTVRELADALGLGPSDVEAALYALETEGFVMRGRFRSSTTDLEWCERRLLARIHRATLDKLRSEIEPVSPAVLMRFYLRHQHVLPNTRMAGLEGLAHLIEQLAGFEVAACAWERDVLPARMEGYDAQLLDVLAWTGRVAWARSARSGERRVQGPVRTTPIALFPRERMTLLRGRRDEPPAMSSAAARIGAFLGERGASFVSDIARGTALEQAHVEEALGELVACGLVTSDGFMGLRALFAERSGARRAGPQSAMERAGRYALLTPRLDEASKENEPARVEAVARALLARWGVVFRRLLERESLDVSWGELVRVFRTLEARGEIRGGRFVAGFSGEQYALPEAVTLLRKTRREEPRGELACLSACDPLNLVGIVTPGARLAAVPASRVLLRDGVPVAALVTGECRWLVDVSDAERVSLAAVLRRESAVDVTPSEEASASVTP